MLPDIMRPADNVFDLYRLGAALSSLAKAIAAKPNHEITFTDIYFEITPVQPLIESVCKDQFIPLDTCKANAQRLRDLMADIANTFLNDWRIADTKEKRDEMWTKVVGSRRVSDLSEQIQAFQYVFSAELNNASLYFVEQVCAYKTSTLIENGDAVFPKNIREKLPELAVIDLKAAGRCLAFDLPTSAGFHIARAVETVLLQYFLVLEIERPDYKTLGKYIETLREKGAPKGIDQKVVAALDQFKDLYRNPIMHPDINLSADEAQMLFANAQSAISAIISDMEKISTAKRSGTLTALLASAGAEVVAKAKVAANGEAKSENGDDQ
jgi:hypothetical protein